MKLHDIKIIGAIVLALALTVGYATADNKGKNTGAPQIAPPNSQAYGESLTGWLGTYWRWYYSGADPAQSVVKGVQLLPLPAGEQLSGSWTPADPAYLKGKLEITLKAGTPFVLPLYAWVGERYDPALGQPDDPPMSDEVALKDVSVSLTLDGKDVITDENKAAFYIPPTPFDPIVVYPTPSSYGSIAAVFFQGVGFLSTPLPVGVHVIHLYEPYLILPGDYPLYPDGLGLIYDNTWIITVVPNSD